MDDKQKLFLVEYELEELNYDIRFIYDLGFYPTDKMKNKLYDLKELKIQLEKKINAKKDV